MGPGVLGGVAERAAGGVDAGRRDRAAMSAAIREVVEAPDLAAAAGVVGERAAWLLGADRAIVVRVDGGGPAIAGGFGPGGPPPGQPLLATGTLGAAIASARPRESRRAGVAEVAAPIVLRGSVGGALLVTGPAERVPAPAAERLAPFADLVSLVAATHETRTQLASLAGTDALTGLGNRRAFDDLLAVEVERAERHGDPLGLVLLDVDHFKGVNDHHAHQVGDRVLAEIGRRLVAIARRGEAVTRIGGEEFAWVLPRTAGAGSEAAAFRALAAVSGRPFDGVGRLTISAGVCELSAGGAEEMVRRADMMLYRAKADGRDTVRRFAPGPELVAAP